MGNIVFSLVSHIRELMTKNDWGYLCFFFRCQTEVNNKSTYYSAEGQCHYFSMFKHNYYKSDITSTISNSVKFDGTSTA